MIAHPKILKDASASDAIQLDMETPITIFAPAVWTAAKLSFLGSFDGVTYGPVKYEGVEVAYLLAAGDVLVVDPWKILRVPFLKLQSGIGGTLVTQGDDREFVLIATPDAI